MIRLRTIAAFVVLAPVSAVQGREAPDIGAADKALIFRKCGTTFRPLYRLAGLGKLELLMYRPIACTTQSSF